MKQVAQVIGAGGHGKVVAAALVAAGVEVVGLFDDAAHLHGRRLIGIPVVGGIGALDRALPAVLGIGDNRARAALAAALDLEWITVIHPWAWLHPSVRPGAGAVVMAGAIVQPDTEIGPHAIINTGASIDHDCRIGAYAHIAPGCHLSGDVHVGEGTLLGVGACARPGSRVGAWAMVGAGGAVVGALPDGCVAVGVPARPRAGGDAGGG